MLTLEVYPRESKEDLLSLMVREPLARIYGRTAGIVPAIYPRGRSFAAQSWLTSRRSIDTTPLFVYLRERDELKSRLRERFKLSPKRRL